MPLKPVDTAIKIIMGPLIDDTDFKTREEAIAYNAAGMEIDIIVEKTDGTITTTAVTPTTGGDYDWTHTDQGYYELELPATGGVSFNNTEEGVLHAVGYVTGVLPFRSPSYDIVPTKIYDSLVKGTDNLEVDEVQLGGSTQSATDLKDFADTGYDPATHAIATCTTNSDMRGTDNAALAATALTNATWTDARAGYLDNINGHTAQTGDSFARIGANGAGLSAIPWNAAWDTEVQSECNDALVALGLDHLVSASVTGTDVADNSIVAYLVSKSATADWDSFTNTTDALEAIRDNQAGADAAAIADAVWDEAIADHTTGTTFGGKNQKAVPSETLADYKATGFSTLTEADVRTAVGLASANLDTQLADLPTVAEFEARTLVAASYFDAATDKVFLGDGAHGGASSTLTLSDYSDFQGAGGGGDATAANQTTIISHLTDIKGTGFVADTHSLPQCITATGFSTFDASSDKVFLGDGAHGGASSTFTLSDYSDFQGTGATIEISTEGTNIRSN